MRLVNFLVSMVLISLAATVTSVGAGPEARSGGRTRLAVNAANGDTVPPAPVVTFDVTPLDMAVLLDWENPSDADFVGTLIRYSTVAFPVAPTDGSPVENGNSGIFVNAPGSLDSFSHTGLMNGAAYYYTAFAFDASMNFAPGTADSTTPFDGIPPQPVMFSQPEPGSRTITLRWANPADLDFDHTMIRYSTADYPLTPADGLPVENGADGMFPNVPASVDSFIHMGLARRQTYYYSAFAADEVPNYAVGALGHATPVGWRSRAAKFAE
jgi:hypothetical protein